MVDGGEGAAGGIGGGPVGGDASFFRARRNAKTRKATITTTMRTATMSASGVCLVREKFEVALAWDPNGSSASFFRIVISITSHDHHLPDVHNLSYHIHVHVLSL